MKFLKSFKTRLDQRFPVGVNPFPAKDPGSNVILLGTLMMAAFIALPAFGGSFVSDTTAWVSAIIGFFVGAIPSSLVVYYGCRRYSEIGRFFAPYFSKVEFTLRNAEDALKRSGLALDSSPGMLIQSARKLFAKSVSAAERTDRKLVKIDRDYKYHFQATRLPKKAKGATLQGYPNHLIEETIRILNSLDAFEDLESVFNSSLSSSAKLSELEELEGAAKDFRLEVEAAIERSSYDDEARRDIERMLKEQGKSPLPLLKKMPERRRTSKRATFI